MRIAILDDYQQRALSSADWSLLGEAAQITAFPDHLFDEDAIGIGNWAEAWRLCRDVDEADVAYVALTLELDGELWTSDHVLETGGRFAFMGGGLA